MKKYSLLIHNFITILYLLITFNLFIFKSINIANIIFIILSSLITSLIIFILSKLTKKIIINKIINFILIFLLTIIVVAQFIHYEFYSSIFSIHSLLRGTSQVFSFFDAIFKIILRSWYYIAILFIPIIILPFINKNLSYEKLNLIDITKLLVIIVISNILFTCFINIKPNKSNVYSKYNLYYNVHYPTRNIKEFGLFKAMMIDFKRYITNFEDKIINLDYTESKTIYNTKEYNITNIDFDKLISNEKDETIKKMHEYFKTQVPTKKNKYTNMFKDKNLIFITGESVYINAISKEYTPTLYKITNNGFIFNNFYTPLYYTSTSDGEYTNLTSLLPKEGTWSLEYSINNNMSYSLGSTFKNNNYKTYAYHNNTYDFYNRYLTHTNSGFDKFLACGNGLEKDINCNLWPESDYEMFNKTYKDYINDDKFLAYYMTVSSHLSYDWNKNDIALKNKDLVNDLDLSENNKSYIATLIELDKAIEDLIKNLEKEKKIDDTVIVFVADHYPYGLSTNDLKELNNNIENTQFDIHKNFLSIYNSKIKEPIIIDKYASNIDILPTLLNLFGISYDSRLYIGKDILSNSDGIVIFNDRSFIIKEGTYNALNNEFIKSNDKISNEYLNSKINEVYNKYLYSRLILDKDYYKYIKSN